MTLSVTELRTHIGEFGEIKAGEKGYMKTLNGTLKDMDTRGTVWFIDLDGYGFAFKSTAIEYFTPKEFEPLPETHNGKPIYWDKGVAYYKETKKECNLRK
jgi:hypothetical protein